MPLQQEANALRCEVERLRHMVNQKEEAIRFYELQMFQRGETRTEKPKVMAAAGGAR